MKIQAQLGCAKCQGEPQDGVMKIKQKRQTKMGAQNTAFNSNHLHSYFKILGRYLHFFLQLIPYH